MKLNLARVIIFTHRMAKMTEFYRDQLGLAARVDPEYDASEWIEFDAGATRIALHKAHGQGSAKGTCAHKLAFYSKNVAATRTALLKKHVKLGEVKIFGKLVMCDGVDPDGNKIQISNRK
jgi:predicted enzyme related to lactoylglutathione lyase